MKRLLLIVLPLLLIVGCSKPVEDSTLINKDGLMYTPDSDKPYTGEVFNNYSTGEKEYQGTYENGLLIQYSYLNKDGSVKEPVNGETLIERGGLMYEVNGQKPYTGDVFELYDNGNRKLSGILKGGKLVSRTEWKYFENGQKENEGIFKDGELDGLFTRWYENGQKKSEETYKNGKQDGVYTSWYENGQKRSELTYKDGWVGSISSKFWNEDGSVKEPINGGTKLWTRTYDDEEIFTIRDTYEPYSGPVFSLDENGRIESEGILEDGKMISYKEFEWYENGQKKSEKTLKDGYISHHENRIFRIGKEEDVLVTQWYENGKKQFEGTYKDGEDFLSNSWDKNGKIMVKDGNGLHTELYENGQKSFEQTFKDGKQDGVYTNWYENGQKRVEETFKEGKKISSKSWNEDGSVKE